MENLKDVTMELIEKITTAKITGAKKIEALNYLSSKVIDKSNDFDESIALCTIIEHEIEILKNPAGNVPGTVQRMQKESITICHYCGKEKQGLSFCIGASSKKDWCMIYGTGKMACPDCYDKAMAEGDAKVDQYIKEWNNQANLHKGDTI